jgi:hypothetical protein
MPKKKTLPDIIIAELILVKADWERTFMGEIKRETDSDGNPVLSCKVIIKEGMAWSRAKDEEQLRKNMDDLCIMKLDYELHSHVGKTVRIFGTVFFLN